MLDQPTPRQILEALLPQLKLAASYAQQIQSQIVALPAKDRPENFFAAALTDADLSIQTFIELTLLATFPQIRFYGEEYERSYNTKYFRSIQLGPADDYLITLDPIDGTRYYLDGYDNYQIILSILNADDFEAVIALNPAKQSYYYALRGKGTFFGSLTDTLETCRPLKIQDLQNTIFLGSHMGKFASALTDRYAIIDVRKDYCDRTQIPNVNGLLCGELTGAILAAGKFIDGAALSFLAREAGFVVTDHQGASLPPLNSWQNYQWPGLVIASSAQIHQDLLRAIQVTIDPS
jgi:fructose-1,6-bisphosphatase/inositol monophosphatase family enzyme